MGSIQQLNLLLVDDEEEFITTLAERLEIRGIDARFATNGQAAIKMIGEDPPHVVVLDIMMPGLGGLEVLEMIRKNHPQVKVILLTGRGSTEEALEGLKQGALDYLMKPVAIEELIQKVENAAAS